MEPIVVGMSYVVNTSLSRMAGEYEMMIEMEGFHLKQLCLNLLKSSIDRRLANENLGLVDALLREWDAYEAGKLFTKVVRRLSVNEFLYIWRLVNVLPHFVG